MLTFAIMGVAVSATVVDSAWALPINTVLLILLAYMTRRVERKQDAAHDNVIHSANSAAAAAEAAAESVRVIKDIGGTIRDARQLAATVVIPTVPTDPTPPPATPTTPAGGGTGISP